VKDGTPSGGPSASAATARLRLDKWLVYARFVKTRGLAAKHAVAGKIRINGRKVNGGDAPVRAGDVLTLAFSHDVVLVQVLGLAERRGPAAEAQALYQRLEGEGAP
jgi:ribosome-associated heat shock protein Hsp15